MRPCLPSKRGAPIFPIPKSLPRGRSDLERRLSPPRAKSAAIPSACGVMRSRSMQRLRGRPDRSAGGVATHDPSGNTVIECPSIPPKIPWLRSHAESSLESSDSTSRQPRRFKLAAVALGTPILVARRRFPDSQTISRRRWSQERPGAALIPKSCWTPADRSRWRPPHHDRQCRKAEWFR
jgi:hypothetical protein